MLLRFEDDNSHVSFAKACAERLFARSNTSALGLEATSVALGWIAVAENDVKTADRLTRFLESGHALPIGSIETINAGHLLAMLHKLTGKIDLAEERFEHTANFLRDAGYRPELALVLSDYADFLVELGGNRAPFAHARPSVSWQRD